jgi:hypothetical protein
VYRASVPVQGWPLTFFIMLYKLWIGLQTPRAKILFTELFSGFSQT